MYAQRDQDRKDQAKSRQGGDKAVEHIENVIPHLYNKESIKALRKIMLDDVTRSATG